MRIYGLLLEVANMLKELFPEVIFLEDTLMNDETIRNIDIHIPDNSRVKIQYDFVSHHLWIYDIDNPVTRQLCIKEEQFVKVEII